MSVASNVKPPLAGAGVIVGYVYAALLLSVIAKLIFPELPEKVSKLVPPELVAVSVEVPPKQNEAGTPVSVTEGSGFTVTVAVVVEEHPLAVAVIVKVVVCEVAVMFVKVPVILVPLPLAAMAVRFTVLSLVQLNVVPGTLFGFVMVIALIADPEQTD